MRDLPYRICPEADFEFQENLITLLNDPEQGWSREGNRVTHDLGVWVEYIETEAECRFIYGVGEVELGMLEDTPALKSAVQKAIESTVRTEHDRIAVAVKLAAEKHEQELAEAEQAIVQKKARKIPASHKKPQSNQSGVDDLLKRIRRQTFFDDVDDDGYDKLKARF